MFLFLWYQRNDSEKKASSYISNKKLQMNQHLANSLKMLEPTSSELSKGFKMT